VLVLESRGADTSWKVLDVSRVEKSEPPLVKGGRKGRFWALIEESPTRPLGKSPELVTGTHQACLGHDEF
jgi:hypothetical protein